MDDKFTFEQVLTASKSLGDLLLHATIEAGTPNVHSAMNTTLFDILAVQNAVYKKMEQKGWYKNTPVPYEKVQQTAMNLSSSQ